MTVFIMTTWCTSPQTQTNVRLWLPSWLKVLFPFGCIKPSYSCKSEWLAKVCPKRLVANLVTQL